MTTYAPTFTPRYRSVYVAAGVQHTIQIRGPRGENLTQMTDRGSNLYSVFNNLADYLADDFEWISSDVALTDEDTWQPTTNPLAVTGLVDATTFTPIHKITGTTFSGRSPGSRARLTVFGLKWPFLTSGNISENGIVTATELAEVGDAVAICTAHFCAGSGLSAAFYNRVTVKPNDLLLKDVRRGIIS
jgi:hypothetical protein